MWRFWCQLGQLQCWIELQPWQWRVYMTLITIALLVVPAIIISACYTVIVRTIWSKSKLLVPPPINDYQLSNSRRRQSSEYIHVIKEFPKVHLCYHLQQTSFVAFRRNVNIALTISHFMLFIYFLYVYVYIYVYVYVYVFEMLIVWYIAKTNFRESHFPLTRIYYVWHFLFMF